MWWQNVVYFVEEGKKVYSKINPMTSDGWFSNDLRAAKEDTLGVFEMGKMLSREGVYHDSEASKTI